MPHETADLLMLKSLTPSFTQPRTSLRLLVGCRAEAGDKVPNRADRCNQLGTKCGGGDGVELKQLVLGGGGVPAEGGGDKARTNPACKPKQPICHAQKSQCV
jgi:hypothetical protein